MQPPAVVHRAPAPTVLANTGGTAPQGQTLVAPKPATLGGFPFAELGISVVASLLTVFLIRVGSLAWAKWFEDLLVRLFLPATPIAGKWISDKVSPEDADSNESYYQETYTLRQSGWNIAGEIEYRWHDNKEAEPDILKFKLKGRLKGEVLSFLYQSERGKSSGSGTFHLEDDKTFTGACVYFHKGEIRRDKYNLRKQ